MSFGARILCVDDHPVTRRGLVQILGLEPGFQVVGEAASAAEAVEAATTLAPDVVVLDMRLPDGDGIGVMARLAACAPKARVVVLSSFCAAETVRAAAGAGACAYLPKDAPPERIAAAVRGALAGRRDFPCGLGAAPEVCALTEREQAVLRLLVAGGANKEIGRRLGISDATARTHVQNILGKLGVTSRAKAVAAAIARGLG